MSSAFRDVRLARVPLALHRSARIARPGSPGPRVGGSPMAGVRIGRAGVVLLVVLSALAAVGRPCAAQEPPLPTPVVLPLAVGSGAPELELRFVAMRPHPALA